MIRRDEFERMCSIDWRVSEKSRPWAHGRYVYATNGAIACRGLARASTWIDVGKNSVTKTNEVDGLISEFKHTTHRRVDLWGLRCAAGPLETTDEPCGAFEGLGTNGARTTQATILGVPVDAHVVARSLWALVRMAESVGRDVYVRVLDDLRMVCFSMGGADIVMKGLVVVTGAQCTRELLP